MKNLKNIAVGDRVWISGRYGVDKKEIKTVLRLTPTQVILNGLREYSSYQRGKKSRYGDDLTYYGIGRADGRITCIATTEECEQWDAKQKAKQSEAELQAAERHAREAKQSELRELFDGQVWVHDSHSNRAGEWQISIYANEDRLRKIAKLLNTLETR